MKFFKKRYLLILLNFLIFSGCVDLPEDVIIPEWDIELNVPLVNRVFSLKEIIKDQDHITIDTSSNIFLLQSGKYFLNSSLSEFVQINESSSLENVPTITSDDSFIVYVQFPQGLEVDSGEFASGVIDLTVNNPSLENVTLIMRMPAFYDLQGDILSIQTDVPSGETNTESLNLNGYKYERPLDQPANLRNSFRVIVRALSQQQGNIVYTNLSVSDLSFNYVTGILPSRSLGNRVSTYDFDVDEVEEYRDKSYLSEAKLTLLATYNSVFNTPNVLEVKDLNIIARRNDGTELFLRDNFNNPGFTIRMNNGLLNTVFDETNSNINDFISFFPDSVILQAEYIVNPDNAAGTFSNLDSINFQVDFSTKSFLALKTISIEDITPIQISEVDREDMRNGKNADIKIEIENGIPLDAWFKIDALDENNKYLFTFTKNDDGGDSILFDAASVNSAGEVIAISVNPPEVITLNESEINHFSRTYNLRFRVSFQTANVNLNPPQIVAIRPSDLIMLKAYGYIKYRINDGD